MQGRGPWKVYMLLRNFSLCLKSFPNKELFVCLFVLFVLKREGKPDYQDSDLDLFCTLLTSFHSPRCFLMVFSGTP